MTPVARVQSSPVEWQAVSIRRPCRICGANRGCRFEEKDAFACCANCQSEWPLTNGAWLHRMEIDSTRVSGVRS